MSSPPPAHFLTTPREIRYQFYADVLQQSDIITITPGSSSQTPNRKSHTVIGGLLHGLSLSCTQLRDELIAWASMNPNYYFSPSFGIIDAEKTIFKFGMPMGDLGSVLWVTIDEWAKERTLKYLNWLLEGYGIQPLVRCKKVGAQEVERECKTGRVSTVKKLETKVDTRVVEEKPRTIVVRRFDKRRGCNGYWAKNEIDIGLNRRRTGSL
jgi:hypothetical protein